MAASWALERLAEAKAVFFYKSTTVSMVEDGVFNARIEFPTNFVDDHGGEFGVNVTFRRRTSGILWRVKLDIQHPSGRRPRVYSSGDGWKAFALDNGITVGDLLVFELIEYSTFLVHLYPPDPRVVRYASNMCGNAGSSFHRQKKKPTLNSKSHSPPSDKLDSVRCFTKILYSSQFQRLDVPARFWQPEGWQKFGGKVFTLEGPRENGQARASVAHTRKQTKCFLGGLEWKLFCKSNALKVGDTVSFTLTESSRFAVFVV